MSRILEIDTPLGAENTLLTAFSGTESLGALPEYRLTLVSKRGNLSAADLLGKNVTAGVELPGRQEMRYFNGYITQFSEAGANPTSWFEGAPVAHQYELTMHPWLWFLTRRSNFRIFQNRTVPQIVQEVCGQYPFAQLELKLSATYAEWEYCCQYRETDFNFVLRLLEQEGIYFNFRHDNGKHTMVLFDENSRHTPRDGYAEIAYDVDGSGYEQHEHIAMWNASRSVQPGRYTLNDFDFKKPDVSLISTLGKPMPHDMSGFELFDFPGEYQTMSEGDRYAQVRMEEMQVRHEVFMAAGPVRGIETGCKFKLANHPHESFNREYLITAARFTIINNQASSGGDGGSFHCSFEALDLRTQFRPPRTTPRPAVQGPQTAMVVGPPGEEIHVDEHGRVKLQFQWDRYNKADDKSSCWVRVSQPWAGKGWGALFMPRVGHEVIVQFIDGDPDRPIVVGRVHNGQSIPPWPMKEQKTRSGFRTRTEKGGASNFNELSFDDKQGAEEVYLHAERNHVLRIKHNRVEEIGNESHLTVQKDMFVDLKADLHERVTGDHNNKVDGSFSLKVGQDWQTKTALKFGVDAGREIHLKAGVNVVIEAGASITLKVGGSFVSIHPGGIDIEGPLVKVNSGGSPGSGSGAAPIAAKAPQRPRGATGGTNMKPVRPKKSDVYSPQAEALKLSRADGAPFCEQCQKVASAVPAPLAASKLRYVDTMDANDIRQTFQYRSRISRQLSDASAAAAIQRQNELATMSGPQLRARDPAAEAQIAAQNRRFRNDVGIISAGPVFGGFAAGARILNAPEDVVENLGIAQTGIVGSFGSIQSQQLRPAWVPKGDPVIHSRYSDGTPVFKGMQPGKINGPLTDSQGNLVGNPHTVLQFDKVNGRIYKAREYGKDGIPIRDIDFTHPTFPTGTLRPGHTAPEQHFYIPNDPLNPKAGYKRGPGQPIGG